MDAATELARPVVSPVVVVDAVVDKICWPFTVMPETDPPPLLTAVIENCDIRGAGMRGYLYEFASNGVWPCSRRQLVSCWSLHQRSGAGYTKLPVSFLPTWQFFSAGESQYSPATVV